MSVVISERRGADDLDKELARCGHRFCRYADDCNIYVRAVLTLNNPEKLNALGGSLLDDLSRGGSAARRDARPAARIGFGTTGDRPAKDFVGERSSMRMGIGAAVMTSRFRRVRL